MTERRVRDDLIETFKMLNGLNGVKKEAWFSIVGENNRISKLDGIFYSKRNKKWNELL